MSAARSARALIRAGSAPDAEALATLLGELGYPTSADAVTTRLAELEAADDSVFVAETDGRVVGFATLHVAPSIEHDGPAGKLAAIAVDRGHRGTGVGRALVDAVEAEARNRGCVLLFLTTAERRADAHAFYERIGLEHTGRRYAKLLR